MNAQLSAIARATTLVLPYPLSANRYWRPVHIGKHITIVPTKEARAYRDEVAKIAITAGLRPLEGRVEFGLKLYPERPQDWAKRAQRDPDTWDDTVRCIDLGNADKVLCDALNGIAWLDDKQIRRSRHERCEPDEHGARVVVTITPIIPAQAIAPDMFTGAHA